MTRSIMEFPPIEPEISEFNPEYETRTYLIHVITPIYGGGVVPGENDLGMVIRPSSIRGHLRFWWRATKGAKFENAKQLFDREGEIWGTSDSPSPTNIRIAQPINEDLRQRKASNNYGFQNKYGPESYVLFPARENESPICKEGFTFELKVNWLKHKRLQYLRDLENAELRRENKPPKAEKINDIGPDIEASIWAWTNFGGVGSRTRRGCGALFCKHTAPQNLEIIGKWYQDHVNGLDLMKQCSWPTLPIEILIGQKAGKIEDIWPEAIEIMRSFRQKVGIGRNPGSSGSSKMPGRSRWPEPEAIREVLKSRMPRHQRLDMPIESFPRAELGLPIVFHFKDNQDPPESELCPVGRKRMASSIILRPIGFGDGRIGVPLIIRLRSETLNQVELKIKGKVVASFGPKSIRDPKLAAYRSSPMAGRSQIGSSLQAFVAYAKENGFKEVGL